MSVSPQLVQIAYIDAQQNLLAGLLLLAISLIALGVALYARRKHHRQPDSELWGTSKNPSYPRRLVSSCLILLGSSRRGSDEARVFRGALWSLSGFISALVATTFFALSLLFLANLWNWVGINHPAFVVMASFDDLSMTSIPF